MAVCILCSEIADHEQERETLSLSFIDFDDDDDCVSLTTSTDQASSQQSHLSALLTNLATADSSKLDQIHALNPGRTQCFV